MKKKYNVNTWLQQSNKKICRIRMQILSNYLFRNLFVSPKIIDIWPCYNKRLMSEFFASLQNLLCQNNLRYTSKGHDVYNV